MKRIPFRLEDTQEYQDLLRQQEETSLEALQAILPSPDERQAVVNPQGVYEPLEPMRFYSGAVGDPSLLNQPMLRGMAAARRGLGVGADLASQVFLEPAVDLSAPMQASMQSRGVRGQMPDVAPDVMASMSPGQQASLLAQALSSASRDQVRRLDSPQVKRWAQKTLDAYNKVEGYPPELQNYLRLIAEGGVSRLMDAMKDPNMALPALAAVGMTPSLLESWLGAEE